ncbi:hypothetical protein [Streptomyces nigrescens]|uniref:hypothetical protein n=1 Tax=Streptomyces nigrescens TaxID=1920 RepID=UPI003499C9C7
MAAGHPRGTTSRADDNGPEERRLVFPPVRNGLDYLIDVIERLLPPVDADGRVGEVSDINLKYALLHLHAGAEVLIKARLEQEHWSLVVQDALPKNRQANGVTRAQFRRGHFKTIGMEEALDRLKQIAEINLDDHRDALTQLTETRNALQHYGLNQTAAAVQSQATAVLDFLITFIHEHLRADLPREERDQVDWALHEMRGRLGRLSDFVRGRMALVAPGLRDQVAKVVACPVCAQMAIVIGTTPIICRFCFGHWKGPRDAAIHYSYNQAKPPTYGLDQRHQHGREVSVHFCPECDEGALVFGAITAAAPERITFLCFACGTDFDQQLCTGGCGNLIRRDAEAAGTGLCPKCAERRRREEEEESLWKILDE